MTLNKPNLIYILADQLRYRSCGYTGDEKALTPNIDAFARDSIDLCNAVSGHPVCAPYRASLFTGKYTTSTGMVINEIRMNPNHRCFAHVMNDGGYETGFIGKWHLYADEWGNHLDAKNSFVPPGEHRLGFDGFFAAYGFHHEYYGDSAYYHLDSPEKIFADKYEPDFQTDLAIRKMNEFASSDKPFALFLSLGTPHDPWDQSNVPPEYLEKFKDTNFSLPENYLPHNDPHADAWAQLSEKERDELTEWMRIYYAMTANLDDNVGRLMSTIKELGLDKNSIIIFTSDHGELFGAHGRRAKNIFYEEAVRVPFLMKIPGCEPRSCDACFNTVDIMPTLLSLMGLHAPREAEGFDISRLLLTGDGPEPEGALMMCCGKTADFGDGNEWRAIRTKHYTYGIFRADGEEHLYDNVEDPYQQNNLAGQPEYQMIRHGLLALMRSRMKKINDTFPSNTYYKENWIRNRHILKTATLNSEIDIEDIPDNL